MLEPSTNLSKKLVREDGHLPALDGVRGIAILLVLLHHLTFYGGMQPAVAVDHVFSTITLAGWSGVDLFFVLSGFLITGILLDAKGGDSFFRNFYLRRALRIFPLYYASLVMFFVVIPHLVAPGDTYRAVIRDQVWYWTYLVNLQTASEGWPAYYALGHFWSLAVEEQFYLVWPLIVFLVGRHQLMTICVTMVIGSLAVRLGLRMADNATAAYVLTLARMDTLAVGAMLALVARNSGGLARLARWATPVAVVSGTAIAAYFLAQDSLDSEAMLMQTVGYPLLATLFGAILVIAATAAPGGRTFKVFAHPALVFLGHYSYAIYVFHHPIIFYVRRTGFRVHKLPTVLGSQLPGQLLYSLGIGSVTIILALLSWYLFESHILKLKRLFPYQHATHTTAAEKYEGNPIPNA